MLQCNTNRVSLYSRFSILPMHESVKPVISPLESNLVELQLENKSTNSQAAIPKSVNFFTFTVTRKDESWRSRVLNKPSLFKTHTMDCKSGDVTQPEVSISLVQTNIADLGSYYRAIESSTLIPYLKTIISFKCEEKML